MPKSRPVRPSRFGSGPQSQAGAAASPKTATGPRKGGEFPCPSCGNRFQLETSRLFSTAPFSCSKCGAVLTITDTPSAKPGDQLTVRISRGEEHRELKLRLGSAGSWPVTSIHESQMAEALQLDSDRAAAVIAGSLVENRLKAVLIGRTAHAGAVAEKMFQSAGPIGSFSAKIDLAYMIGLISPAAHKDLHTVRTIRNDFAHHLEISNFESQSIAARCRNLKLIETHVAEYEAKEGSLLASLNFDEPRICVPRYSERLDHPRERYLLTAQLFCFCLVLGELVEPIHAYI